MSNTSLVLKEAAKKFGRVDTFKERKDGSFILCIERANPVFPAKPFMTIRAHVQPDSNDYPVAFYYGNYDLSYEDSEVDFNLRCKH